MKNKTIVIDYIQNEDEDIVKKIIDKALTELWDKYKIPAVLKDETLNSVTTNNKDSKAK